MSIPAADLRKLVKIVRQYEVIYGGGISSGDAAVREECDALIAGLESELGGRPARGGESGAGRARGKPADSLPSLVEARKRPRVDDSPKPRGARAAEIAELGASGRKDGAAAVPDAGKAPKAKAKAEAKASRKAAPAPPKGGSSKRSASASKAPIAPSRKPASAAQAASAKGGRKGAQAPVPAAAPAAKEKRRFAALHLFDAFSQNRLPKYGGYIVCVRFAEDSGYTVIEIIGYENLQDIYPEGDTLVFKSVGCKLYAIVEPTTYLLKSVEPVNRPSDQMVPYRFSELLRITTKRFQSILIGRKPVFMPTSFSVFKPAGEDLAVLFYDTAEVYANLQDFTIMILRDRLGVPATDSRKAAQAIAGGAREFRLWLDEA